MKVKNVTIREDQQEFIKEHCINLSRFLQKHLDREMEIRGEVGDR